MGGWADGLVGGWAGWRLTKTIETIPNTMPTVASHAGRSPRAIDGSTGSAAGGGGGGGGGGRPPPQKDGADPKPDPDGREPCRTLAEGDRRQYRKRDGGDGGGRRHHRHGADGQRAIQQRDADAAREACRRAPPQ